MFPLRDANPRTGPAFITWLLIAINVAVFLYQVNLGSRPALFTFIGTYGFVPDAFFERPGSHVHMLFTSMFLHGGLAHLIGNMFFLFVFGDNIENRMGHLAFLAFYVLGGVFATFAHGIFVPNSQTPMLGASGAISAVLGAYILLYPRIRILTFVPPFFLFWLPAWIYLGYWALIQFVEAVSGLTGGVAWWAHLGGFVFGLVAVRYFAPDRTRGREDAGQEDWPG